MGSNFAISGVFLGFQESRSQDTTSGVNSWSSGVVDSSARLNIFTGDNMGVMICLGQGGLRSLSASSSI